MEIEPNKYYRTRDGRLARVYATDGGHPTPVHGAVLCHLSSDVGKRRGWWEPYFWKSNGRDTVVHGWCVGSKDRGPHSWLDLVELEQDQTVVNS